MRRTIYNTLGCAAMLGTMLACQGLGLVGVEEAFLDTSLENKGVDAGSPEVPEAPTASAMCVEYCDEITTFCTGPNQQYIDRAQCLAVCAALPEGLEGSSSNDATCRHENSLNVRYAAGSELPAFCLAAGPTGGGVCGTECEAYCALMDAICTEEAAYESRYQNVEDCLEECPTLPVSPETYAASDPAIADGGHLQCRIYHVTSAAVVTPGEHCRHAFGLAICNDEGGFIYE